MAVASLPGSLTPVLIDGFAYVADLGLSRTQMDGGVSRQRRTYDTMPQTYAVGWRLSSANLAALMVWMQTNADAWFDIAMPNPLGAATVTARFVENLKVTSLGTLFDVRSQIEVLYISPDSDAFTKPYHV